MRSPPILALTAAIVLAGCMDRDPYRRTDVWRPTGANAANIAAMVANPADLIRGQASVHNGSRADVDVMAIERIWEGHPRSLLPGVSANGKGGAASQNQGGDATSQPSAPGS